MKKAWYLAIDGGGTKTEYCLFDEQFCLAECYQGGCVNHDFLLDGWEDAARELESGIRALLERRGLKISDIADVVAGLSGVDNRSDQMRAEQCFRDMGIVRFLICNDGFLPIKSECGGWGIAYNCGTGVCCAGIGKEDAMVKCAGFDEWSGDAGGGRWIAVHIFRAVYRRRVLQEKETYLTTAYQEKFACRSEEDIVNSVTLLKEPAQYPEVARAVVELFFAALEQNDRDAQFMAEEMVNCAAENIRVVCEKLAFRHDKIPIVLTGSVHTKAANQMYLDLIKQRVQREISGRGEIFLASASPVEGAREWLRERSQIVAEK